MNILGLTEHDWLQISQAANGYISGRGNGWPHLMTALKKLCGLDLSDKHYSELIVVCKAALIERKQKQEIPLFNSNEPEGKIVIQMMKRTDGCLYGGFRD